MKLIVSSVLLVVLVAAVSADDRIGSIPILKSENVQNDDGSYAFSYESADGIVRSETGSQKEVAPDAKGSTSQGTISWKAPNGKTVTITFTADENGYQPKVTVA